MTRTAVMPPPEVVTTREGDTRTVVMAPQGAVVSRSGRPTPTRPADKRRRFPSPT